MHIRLPLTSSALISCNFVQKCRSQQCAALLLVTAAAAGSVISRLPAATCCHARPEHLLCSFQFGFEPPAVSTQRSFHLAPRRVQIPHRRSTGGKAAVAAAIDSHRHHTRIMRASFQRPPLPVALTAAAQYHERLCKCPLSPTPDPQPQPLGAEKECSMRTACMGGSLSWLSLVLYVHQSLTCIHRTSSSGPASA